MEYIATRCGEDELQHYGILGMKWGVRRYQNLDGSYTKAGLKRYRDAKSSYKEASDNLRTAKKTGGDVDTAKAEKKTARAELSSARKNLSTATSADRGKELAQEGYTIREIKTKRALNQYRSLLGAGAIATATSLVSGLYGIPIAAPWLAAAAVNGAATGFIRANAATKIKDLENYRKRL